MASTVEQQAAPRRADRPGRTAPPMRLTRRGRTVVRLLVLTALTLLVLAFSLGRLAGSAEAGDGSGVSAVVVQPGDTLWQIARAADPQADPRDTIAAIAALNGLTGPIVPGQQLLVPA
jgi:nucleoid-associated protein YgaU